MKRSSFLISIQDGKFKFKSAEHRKMFEDWLKTWDGENVRIELSKVKSQRSYQQNRALHLWFKLVAEELNSAGYSVQDVLSKKMDFDFNKDIVKETLWRPAQERILGKKSTVDLRKTGEIDEVWEHLNRHLGEKFGIHVEFPHLKDSDNI